MIYLDNSATTKPCPQAVEAIGVERSKKAVSDADLVLFVCDGSHPLTEEDLEIIRLCKGHEKAIGLINKTDLGTAVTADMLPFDTVISICAKENRGLEELEEVVNAMFASDTPCDGSILTNARQYDAIRRSYEAMGRALDGLKLGLTPDAVLTDVEEAMEAMGEVTGATVREDITARIFERFCVGK